MSINPRLEELLEVLATKLSEEREAEIGERHRRALSWEKVDRLPLVMSYPPPDGKFGCYPHAEVFDDPEKMLFNELVSTYGTSVLHRETVGDDLPCTLRANFGVGLVASVFGARIEQVENNPPWVHPFESADEFWSAVEQFPLDLSRGWIPRVEERYATYRRILRGCPRLESVIRLVLPDLQGPMDNVELLRGSEVFPDFYAEPERLDQALRTLAAAQVAIAQRLMPALTDGPSGWSHQHGFAVRGSILIRADTAIMLSPAMYQSQVKPHDSWVLTEMGGGGLHSCGKIEHLVDEFLSAGSIRCLDLGQPLMNDMDRIYRVARERQVSLLRVSVREDELTSGSVLDRFPTGVSLLHNARSLDDAKRVMTLYREASRARSR